MATFQNISDEWQRLDWLILQNGWVSLYWKKEVLEKDLQWFGIEKYSIIKFDCRTWSDKNEMHKQLKGKLNFPDYYGENLDALNDCLSDLEINDTGLIVVFQSLDSIEKNTISNLLDIFTINARRQLLFGNRLIILCQVDNPRFEIDPVGSTPVMWNGAEWLNSKRE